MSERATTSALGRRFVEALAAKDADALTAVLHPEIDFRALTPNRVWEAHYREGLLDILFRAWFTHDVDVDESALVGTDAFAHRAQVRFRFRGRNADGPMVVEQQAYLTERDSVIDWMRMVCSGQRPSAMQAPLPNIALRVPRGRLRHPSGDVSVACVARSHSRTPRRGRPWRAQNRCGAFVPDPEGSTGNRTLRTVAGCEGETLIAMALRGCRAISAERAGRRMALAGPVTRRCDQSHSVTSGRASGHPARDSG